jgi:hypothetical protein
MPGARVPTRPNIVKREGFTRPKRSVASVTLRLVQEMLGPLPVSGHVVASRGCGDYLPKLLWLRYQPTIKHPIRRTCQLRFWRMYYFVVSRLNIELDRHRRPVITQRVSGRPTFGGSSVLRRNSRIKQQPSGPADHQRRRASLQHRARCLNNRRLFHRFCLDKVMGFFGR